LQLMDILSFFGLSSLLDINFILEGEEARKSVVIQTDKGPQRILVYHADEAVKGYVALNVKPGKKIEHQGIRLDLIGEIEVVYDRGNHHDFMTLTQTLCAPGVLSSDAKYEFDFASNAEKAYESYNGVNVRLRYFLRLTIIRSLAANLVKEHDVWVINFQDPPELNSSIKMEVGIEECLHIEFEYGRSKYHLKDVILGKIYFLLVRIKIKYMELALVKRESTGTAPNVYTETETLTKFEIMDGAPVRGESIPVRLFLGAFDLTPSYKNICNKFTVKYLLNLVLVDEEDRRYFKQTDITLWRRQNLDEHKLVTVRDAQAALDEGKKQRRKKRKEKNKSKKEENGDTTQGGDDSKEEEKEEEKEEKEAVKQPLVGSREKD